jgi:hypothetical protein
VGFLDIDIAEAEKFILYCMGKLGIEYELAFRIDFL